MKRISGVWAAGFGAAALLAAGAAHADVWSASVYGGWNGSYNSDVHFTGPGTDWTVSNVPWDGVSWDKSGGAPYYGARLTWWPTATPGIGFALDYTHAKIRAVRDATVSYAGTINGAPMTSSGQIQSLFNVLEYTDGLNLVTVNALYKLAPVGRVHPYIGAGVGVSIPHVEVTGNGTTVPFARTFAYEFGGLAAQALVGVDVPLTQHISLFGEYKFSVAQVNGAPLTGGYAIHTTTFTNHLLAGLTISIGR